MNRRPFLSLLGTGLTAGIAGCTGFNSENTVVKDGITIDSENSDLSESDFHAAVTNSHDTYGKGGVWGHNEREPEHDLDFQGAWTTTLDHQSDVQSDHLLALYRLPPAPNGTESSQVWIWSGVTPTNTEKVRRISAGVALPGTESWLGIYSPAQDYRASDEKTYTVESGRLDVATLTATIPISSGTIGFGEGTQIGDGGAYYPYWEGDSPSTQSLVATTEIRWAATGSQQLVWKPTVETEP